MKRLLMILALLLLCLGIFCACNDGDTAVTPPAVCQHRDADDNSLCDKCDESYTDGTDVTPEHTHAFGAWEQTVAPTCQAKGVEKRTCACGHSETRDTAKNMNNHVAWGNWGVTTAATCQAKGAEKRTCACGESETRDIEKNMNNHTAWGNWGVTTPATCGTAGEEKRTCACGNFETRAIGATGVHVYDQKVKESAYLKSEATSDSPAIYHYSCTCGAKGSATFYDGYVLRYTLTSDYSFRVVSGLIGDATEIEIPRIFDGLRVVAIAAGAFQGNTTLQKIILPNTIEQIGQNAFAGCTALTEINLPTSISMVGNAAFKDCTALEHIEIPGSITTLSEALFQNCTNLKTVTVNEGVVTIGNLVFDNCKKLQNFTMPDTVTTLGNMAFRHAEGLVSISFSKNLTAIGNATFQYCVRLASVELHAGITIIGNSAFSDCDGLKTLRILGNITSWGNSAFYECQGLTSIYLASATTGDMGADNYIFYNAGISGAGITLTLSPNAVVPERLFEPFAHNNLPKLTAVVIEDGATTVNGFKTYNYLPYLTSITYPDSVTDPAYGAWNDSLWWQAKEIGEVYINDVFYGYKCPCQICTPLEAVEENRVEPKCEVDGSYDMAIYCEACGTEVKRTNHTIPQLEHIPATAWTSDGTHHWHACTQNGCTAELNKTAHTPSATWTSNGTYHWHTCTQNGCTAKLNKTAHTPSATWTSDGTHHWHTCTQNGCTAKLNKTAHTPSATWTSDGTHHWHTCTQDGCTTELNKAVHTYNNENTCSFCGDYKDKGVEFTLSNGTYSVTNYTGSAAAVMIPSTYKGIAVTSIAASAFEGCGGLTSITIPSSVTTIGDSAFEGCTGLMSITLPFVGATLNGTSDTHFGYIFGASSYSGNKNYVPTSLKTVVITGGKSIGEEAFRGCTGLTSITIPNSVTSIGKGAFYGCTGLTSITIPNSVTSIGNYAFDDCTGLTSITVAKGNTKYHSAGNCLIETASKRLIAGCKNSVIPTDGSVTSIGNSAFDDCTGLTSITIPNSITSIDNSAFYGCTGLVKVVISDVAAWCGISFVNPETNPLYYAKHLYLGENEITNLVIPEGVTSIGNCAFSGCKGLTSITIPNSVTSIGDYAFYGCSGLTSVTIGNSVTSIGNYAFRDCTGLTSITVAPRNMKYHSAGNCLIETATKTLIAGCNNSVIPADGSVTSIGELAFSDLTGLTSITIPNSVTSIGNYAFYGCTGLTSITIGNGVTSIGNYAFTGCTGLTSVTIGNSVTSIGDRAFYWCEGLTSITIPNSVTSIGKYAFAGCGLTSVTFQNQSGWKISKSSDFSTYTSVTFSNAFAAANRLTDFAGYYWKRG